MKNKRGIFISMIFILIIAIGTASASDDMLKGNDLNLNEPDQDNGCLDLNQIQDDYDMEKSKSSDNPMDSKCLSSQIEKTQSANIPINSNSIASQIENSEDIKNNTENANQSAATNSSNKDTKPKQKTFSDIQDLIDKAKPGSTIKLSGTYISQSKEILINKKITIQGINGKATLNAKGLSGIFKIKAKGTILNNLNLINGKAKEGGAIWSSTQFSIRNSNLKNNKANYGGAIYAKSNKLNSYSTSISNCIFYRNSGKSGGAIYSGANLKVLKSKFSKNSAKSGGAICCEDDDDINKDKLSISNSIFYMNRISKDYSQEDSSTYNYGGAVLTDFKYSSISKSKFTSNSAKTKGGAISATRNLNCNNCKFYSNTARSGSAIYVTPNIIDFEEYSFRGKVNLKNCLLGSNKANDKVMISCDYQTANLVISNLIVGKYKYSISNKKNHYFTVKLTNKNTRHAVKKAKIGLKIKYFHNGKLKTVKTSKKTNKKGKVKFNSRSLTKTKEGCEFYISLANSKKYPIMSYGFIR